MLPHAATSNTTHAMIAMRAWRALNTSVSGHLRDKTASPYATQRMIARGVHPTVS